jgi:hypothetical protein
MEGHVYRARLEGHACHARSEGHACHARGIAMDHPTWCNGRDKRIPPNCGRDKRVPPRSEGHACHARGIAMDHPTWCNGRDKRIPPNCGRDKRIPPIPAKMPTGAGRCTIAMNCLGIARQHVEGVRIGSAVALV